MPGWGEAEPALALSVMVVACEPPRFACTSARVAHVGLHALARRYQRGDGTTDAEMRRSLNPIAQAARDAIGGAGEFAVEAAGGRWVGTVMLAGRSPVLAVRSFVES